MTPTPPLHARISEITDLYAGNSITKLKDRSPFNKFHYLTLLDIYEYCLPYEDLQAKGGYLTTFSNAALAQLAEEIENTSVEELLTSEFSALRKAGQYKLRQLNKAGVTS